MECSIRSPTRSTSCPIPRTVWRQLLAARLTRVQAKMKKGMDLGLDFILNDMGDGCKFPQGLSDDSLHVRILVLWWNISMGCNPTSVPAVLRLRVLRGIEVGVFRFFHRIPFPFAVLNNSTPASKAAFAIAGLNPNNSINV